MFPKYFFTSQFLVLFYLGFFVSNSESQIDYTKLVSLPKFNSSPRGVALDLTNEKIYWTLHTARQIQRSNLDGSNVEILVTLENTPFTIAIDSVESYVYFSLPWDRFNNGKIQRIKFNGTYLEDVVILPPFCFPETIVIDHLNRYIYWTVPSVVPQNNFPRIQKTQLDGNGNIITVVSNISSPRGLAIDPYLNRLYWVSSAPDVPAIYYSSLDGTKIVKLQPSQIETPRGLAVEIGTLAGFIYWSDIERGGIFKVNTTGYSSIVTLGLFDPYGLAIDINANKLFFVDSGAMPPFVGQVSSNPSK